MTAQESVESGSRSKFELYSESQIVDMKEPTLLPGSDSLASSDATHDIVLGVDDSVSASRSSSGSQPSDGQLNKAFKFGARPTAQVPPLPVAVDMQSKPQTLSDIIPAPSHVRSLSGSSMMDEDDSVIKSIFAKVSDIPPLCPRPRANSDSSAKHPFAYRHSRHSSGLGFVGFDSFDEVRHGFEFGSDRAPPRVAMTTASVNLCSASCLVREGHQFRL
jgi:serine/arginine repetitive matrix protein 2